MTAIQYKHTLPLQIRFNDIDLFGHLNNTVYFSFFDLGKNAYFETIHHGDPNWDRMALVKANVNVDFIKPIFLREKTAVQTSVVAIGTKSFTLHQRIINIETGELKCMATTIMVGFDTKTNAALAIIPEWREAVNRFEGTAF